MLGLDLLVSDGCRGVCVTVQEVTRRGVLVEFQRSRVSFLAFACRGTVLSVAAPTLNVGCCMKPCWIFSIKVTLISESRDGLVGDCLGLVELGHCLQGFAFEGQEFSHEIHG